MAKRKRSYWECRGVIEDARKIARDMRAAFLEIGAEEEVGACDRLIAALKEGE